MGRNGHLRQFCSGRLGTVDVAQVKRLRVARLLAQSFLELELDEETHEVPDHHKNTICNFT